MNGVHGTQSVEMTLRSIDANEAVVGIALRQEAPRQDVANPFAPGATSVLEKFQGDGGGDVVIDRLTAIVLSGNIVVKCSTTLTTDSDGKKSTGTLVGVSTTQLAATILRDLDGEAR